MHKTQSSDKSKPNLNRSVFCFAGEEDPKDQKYCFKTASVDVAVPVEGSGKKRTFSGVAYSGEPITDHWWWDRVIFDLESMVIKGRIPALLDHKSSQRVGAIDNYSIDNSTGLTVSGALLTNEFGTAVAQDSDDGFPWQMSVRIEPDSIEEIEKGQVVVNGKTYQAPITVFRGGRIREVSFCALGADDNTSAVAASHNPKSKEDTSMDLAQAQAKISSLESEAVALTQKNTDLQTQLTAFAADKRTTEIAALAKEIGREFSAEDATEMSSLDDKAFAFAAKQLRASHTAFAATKPKLPAYLFSEQVTGGKENQGETKSIAEMAKNY